MATKKPSSIEVHACDVCARAWLEQWREPGAGEPPLIQPPGKPACFLVDGWWRRHDTGGPYRALQYELGTRVVGALKRENRACPPSA